MLSRSLFFEFFCSFVSQVYLAIVVWLDARLIPLIAVLCLVFQVFVEDRTLEVWQGLRGIILNFTIGSFGKPAMIAGLALRVVIRLTVCNSFFLLLSKA